MSALSHLSPTVVIRAARGSDGPALQRLVRAGLDRHLGEDDYVDHY